MGQWLIYYRKANPTPTPTPNPNPNPNPNQEERPLNLPMLASLPPTRPLTAVHLTRGVAPPTLVSMMSAAYSSLWLADPPAAPPPFAPPPAAPPPGSALGFDSPRRPTTSQGTPDHNPNPDPNPNPNPNPTPNPNQARRAA